MKKNAIKGEATKYLLIRLHEGGVEP